MIALNPCIKIFGRNLYYLSLFLALGFAQDSETLTLNFMRNNDTLIVAYEKLNNELQIIQQFPLSEYGITDGNRISYSYPLDTLETEQKEGEANVATPKIPPIEDEDYLNAIEALGSTSSVKTGTGFSQPHEEEITLPVGSDGGYEYENNALNPVNEVNAFSDKPLSNEEKEALKVDSDFETDFNKDTFRKIWPDSPAISTQPFRPAPPGLIVPNNHIGLSQRQGKELLESSLPGERALPNISIIDKIRASIFNRISQPDFNLAKDLSGTQKNSLPVHVQQSIFSGLPQPHYIGSSYNGLVPPVYPYATVNAAISMEPTPVDLRVLAAVGALPHPHSLPTPPPSPPECPFGLYTCPEGPHATQGSGFGSQIYPAVNINSRMVRGLGAMNSNFGDVINRPNTVVAQSQYPIVASVPMFIKIQPFPVSLPTMKQFRKSKKASRPCTECRRNKSRRSQSRCC